MATEHLQEQVGFEDWFTIYGYWEGHSPSYKKWKHKFYSKQKLTRVSNGSWLQNRHGLVSHVSLLSVSSDVLGLYTMCSLFDADKQTKDVVHAGQAFCRLHSQPIHVILIDFISHIACCCKQIIDIQNYWERFILTPSLRVHHDEKSISDRINSVCSCRN